MTQFAIKYSRSRHPIRQKRADGSLGCCGCGGDIPSHRQTWCSGKCFATYDPASVRKAVEARDGGKCQLCGVDCKHAKALWRGARARQFELFRNEIGASYYTTTIKMTEWVRLNPCPARAEYDHIIPFSEGGLTTLENMRLLCGACHKKRTKDWRAEKAKKPLAPKP